jgi:2-polyprenyl-6-methoxyphenol hydroxylase-like FAD-dependent oxidoreductase
MGERRGDRAVVLGGSMAGLLAARVLSESYDQVMIIDRDELSGVREPRRGVPQGRHVHGLLARGQEILEELFPGFTDGMRADGVPTADLGHLRWIFQGRRLAKADTGCICISAARPTLESHVRDGVAKLSTVDFVEGTDVLGLVATGNRARIIGVRTAHPERGEEELAADLVVDATGRGSRLPAWLAEFGYERPAEEKVKIGLTYTSRNYRSPDESVIDGDVSINPVGTPSHPRGAFFTRLENGRFILSCTGVLGDSAPTDPAGFTEYVRSLPAPEIYAAIKDAVPLDDPAQHRYPASQRRRYERLNRFPERLLVVGDAFCSFNPVYGQGMTVAALEALALREHLSRGVPEPLPFLADVSTVIDVPWDISAGGDLGFPAVEGRRPLKTRFANAYMAKLQAAAVTDGQLTRTFMRVAGLVDPPTDLMKPSTMLRVLRRT